MGFNSIVYQPSKIFCLADCEPHLFFVLSWLSCHSRSSQHSFRICLGSTPLADAFLALSSCHCREFA